MGLRSVGELEALRLRLTGGFRRAQRANRRSPYFRRLREVKRDFGGPVPKSFKAVAGRRPCSKNQLADSFSDFFSGRFVGTGEGLFAGVSLGALAFSPTFSEAGDSFLAASLYESLR